ncbi:MAG TPA: hypothetical protein VK934_06875 [Fimbriimonas sp.]|nr:hypothetical protein [Fimbriimonas sp.]
METRHIEEQASIILDHIKGEDVDPSFVLRHAEALLIFALSAQLPEIKPFRRKPTDRQMRAAA